jgi:hypothetical protein
VEQLKLNLQQPQGFTEQLPAELKEEKKTTKTTKGTTKKNQQTTDEEEVKEEQNQLSLMIKGLYDVKPMTV